MFHLIFESFSQFYDGVLFSSTWEDQRERKNQATENTMCVRRFVHGEHTTSTRRDGCAARFYETWHNANEKDLN